MNVGVIIPVYKNPKQLERCLDAINNLETEHDVTVFTHDNNTDNIGFTKAINLGLAHYNDGETDYTVVLNQDCYMKPDFMDEAIKFMEEHPKCFIGGAKQLSDTDEDLIIHGGCTQAFPNGMHIYGRTSQGSCAKDKQMPWVNGACMVVNMKHMPVVGNMDENFYLICSDSDWCYAARLKGLEVWYMSKATVIHEGGVSTKRSSDTVERLKVLDAVFFKDKWIGDGCFRELSQEVF